MGSKGKPENAKNYGISLASDEQKAMWKKFLARETRPRGTPTIALSKLWGSRRTFGRCVT